MDIPQKIALAALGITVIGWPLTAYLAYRFGLRSQRILRAESTKQEAMAGVSKWQREVCGLAAGLRAQIVQADLPSDWFHDFKAAVIELRRLTAAVPTDIDPEKRRKVVSTVDQLLALSGGDGSEAVYGVQKVINLLQRLEELTDAG